MNEKYELIEERRHGILEDFLEEVNISYIQVF